MNVFVGFRNSAGFMSLLSDYFESKGIDATKLLVYQSAYYNDECANKFVFQPLRHRFFLINLMRRVAYRCRLLWFLLSTLHRLDLYIFFGYDSFLPGRLDYFILKLFRKRVLIFFQGSDVRYIPLHNKISRYFEVPELELESNLSFLNAWWRSRLPEMLNF